MIEQKLILQQDQSVLDQILEAKGLQYKDFCELLNIHRNTLLQYRTGKNKFRLDMSQMKTLSRFLSDLGLSLEDLPDDWIQDKRELEGRKAS